MMFRLSVEELGFAMGFLGGADVAASFLEAIVGKQNFVRIPAAPFTTQRAGTNGAYEGRGYCGASTVGRIGCR